MMACMAMMVETSDAHATSRGPHALCPGGPRRHRVALAVYVRGMAGVSRAVMAAYPPRKARLLLLVGLGWGAVVGVGLVYYLFKAVRVAWQ